MSSPATPDTNKLVAYNPQPVPTVGGLDLLYVQKELASLRTALRSTQEVLRKHEARLKALGG